MSDVSSSFDTIDGYFKENFEPEKTEIDDKNATQKISTKKATKTSFKKTKVLY